MCKGPPGLAFGLIALLGLAAPAPAMALQITLSEMSSDPTPESQLDATLDFSILGGDQLQIVVTNTTTAPNEFNINEIFWNASSDVTSLSLASATHSVEDDVATAWAPVDTNTMVNGFGVFDFGLTDGVGETDPSVIQPGNSVTFVLDITGACATAMDCDAFDDFLSQENTGGKSVAGKFVNGPGDDSAFGASAAIPEPGTFGLACLGLFALAMARRRRSR